MSRKKKDNVEIVAKSSYNKADMPHLALAISVSLVAARATTVSSQGMIDGLRESVRWAIEDKLHLEVDSISLVLVEENPPTRI